ncbi:MAG: ISNCY family transposase [Bacteroides sp.]|nr:ISNCY family transposase [Prevotella sp.]MCM1407017.1 ISNCY family transposase [Treponema brennaborense]MCM1470168.1 ISNCY family transposase [Bacteroides sp.]
MEKLELTDRQTAYKSVIEKVIRKEISTKQAAFDLCVTQRCIEYKVIACKILGDRAFIHGNKGRSYEKEEFKLIRQKIVDIFQNTKIEGETFEGISYSYFVEILKDSFGIKVSESYAKKILKKDCRYISPRSSRLKDKIFHFTRERKARKGELIQADGSEHDWFRDGHKSCIHGFIDDATGQLVSLYMTKNECSFGYHECFRTMALEHGLPEAIYTDKAQIFCTVRDGKITDDPTQFGRIMNKFGIELIPANSPQAKGRVERMWQTLQGQLPFWFWLHGVKTIEEANAVLPKYITKFNRKYAVKPKSDESAFIPADMEQVNQYLRLVTIGKVDSGGVFELKGYRFFCKELAGQKVKICLSIKGGLWCEPEKTKTHYKVELLETDTSGTMPEVWKDLIEEYFLKNAKPKYREVYKELEYELKPA